MKDPAKDPAKARQLIQAAADQGLAPARQALAELESGGPKPVPGAELWAQGVARYNAGDHTAAATLVRQAAEAGYPLAFYEMGYFYENGDGVPQDMAEAARWYNLGAAKGEPAAEAALGQLYEDGNTVRDDWVIPGLAGHRMKLAQLFVLFRAGADYRHVAGFRNN